MEKSAPESYVCKQIVKTLRRKIRLTNDGQLWVYFLGCGSAFSKKQNQTNLLVVKGDEHLLVDCGSTCSRALQEAGLSILDIKNVLITHSHADHVGGLEELLLMNRYVARSRPRFLVTEEYGDILWDRTLRGGAEMNEIHDGKGLSFDDYADFLRPTTLSGYNRDAREFRLGDMSIRVFRTRHYPEQARRWDEAMYSVGLVIDDRVVFSGDTQYDSSLFEEADPHGRAEFCFHDVQFFTGGIHASLDEISSLPGDIKRKTLLVHYGDNFSDYAGPVRSAGFKGFAQSGRIYEFSPSSR